MLLNTKVRTYFWWFAFVTVVCCPAFFSILYLNAVVSSSQFVNVFIATSNLYLVFHYCSFIYQYCDFFVFPLIGANSDDNITYIYITEKRWDTENQFFPLLRIDFGQRLKCKRELFFMTSVHRCSICSRSRWTQAFGYISNNFSFIRILMITGCLIKDIYLKWKYHCLH